MRSLLRLSFIFLVPLIVAFLAYRFVKHAIIAPLNSTSTEQTVIVIEPGKKFKETCKELQAKNIIRYSWSLLLLAKLKKADSDVKAGEYELSPSMAPKAILAKLVAGDVLKRMVTVKEGMTIADIAKLVEAAGLVSVDDFIKMSASAGLLARAGIAATNFEGYLFPDTYQFSRPIDAEHIIWRMLEEGEAAKHWPSDYSIRAEELSMSRHEILTFASIIEKETGLLEEQPVISSVFHNRLNQGMKLQSDPTVIYGIKNFDGNLKREHLQDPHPYNTYVIFGLPPGPICSPGDSAIKAALYPKETTYLFFVADGSGGHVFSTTLKEHNEAVTRFQK